MRRAQQDTSTSQPSLAPVRLRPFSLRFHDRRLEAAFRADYFRHAVGNFRFGLVAGIVLWAVSGPVLYPGILALADKSFDLAMRYGVFIPVLLVGIVLSFMPFFERIWEWVAVGIALVTIGVWVYYAAQVLTIPAEYGYIGLILITAFTYALLRLRFLLVVLVTVVGIVAYMPYAVFAVHIFGITTNWPRSSWCRSAWLGVWRHTGWSAHSVSCSSVSNSCRWRATAQSGSC